MDFDEPLFRDRRHAGRILAQRLLSYAGRPDVVVLGLPRGGVPVAYEVARALRAPLGCFLVRKLGVPGHEELAMGAVASGGTIVVNDEAVQGLQIPDPIVERAAAIELEEISRRERLYRGALPPPPVTGRTVIVVDDGLATGATMRAAIEALRQKAPAGLIVAAPVAARETLEQLAPLVDELVCLGTPEPFFAVGQWYENFEQVADEEVRALLERAGEELARPPAPPRRVRDRGGEIERSVEIPARGALLLGDLTVPPGASGIVIFAHGSGSSRHSPRNQFVAQALARNGFATLLLDLLTLEEEEEDRETGRLRFDIGLLAERLVGATDWVAEMPATRKLPIGYFGASTGAAAALIAAAERPLEVRAIVARGGRPDLAGPALYHVRAPTRFIVGGNDPVVLDLNREALDKLGAHKRLDIVPGATHLFEEPGALEQVAEHAIEWFAAHLSAEKRERSGDPFAVADERPQPI
jgi:putative phosphoribosyl transferase